MSTVSPLSVRDFLEEKRLSFLDLEVVAGLSGLESRFITNPRIQKPGLALAGFLPYVKPGRIQILGESEFSYLDTLEEGEAARRIIAVVNAGVPAILAAKGHLPSDEVLNCCNAVGVPFLSTRQRTSDTIEGVSAFLEDARLESEDPGRRNGHEFHGPFKRLEFSVPLLTGVPNRRGGIH